MRNSAVVAMLLGLVALWGASPPSRAQTAPAARVQLGQSVFPLNGPWRFHTGDDLRWARPDFDDSGWEQVDLTPEAGAHDGDVGLPGYVPGWSQRGHARYSGYAWYRLRTSIDAAGAPLALAGPTLVDSTYQVYVDGRLMGGPGVFSGGTPVVYSVRPTLYSVPGPANATHLIAFRVWMDAGDLGTESGGIHVAPTIGRADDMQQLYQVQWLRTFNGYVVDAVEPMAFVILALMACALIASRTGSDYHWLAVALVLLALLRLNQVLYAWTSWQSLRSYDIATAVVLRPLVLAAWTLAWRDWFGLEKRSRWTWMVGALAIAYVGVALAGRPWFLPGAERLHAVANVGVVGLRLAFAVLYLGVVMAGAARLRGPLAALGGLAALLVGVGLFATELNQLGIPGIWFPYGVGVSRGQFAYAAFVVVMFGLLLVRQASEITAARQPAHTLVPAGSPGPASTRG